MKRMRIFLFIVSTLVIGNSAIAQTYSKAQIRESLDKVDEFSWEGLACDVAAIGLSLSPILSGIEKGIDKITVKYKRKAPYIQYAKSAAKTHAVDLDKHLGTAEIKCQDLGRLIYGKRQAQRFPESRVAQGDIWLYAFCPAEDLKCQDEVRNKILKSYK
jgi:hypothetical protein